MRPKKWIYVQVEKSETIPASFAHTTVHAHNEEGAYERGREHFKANPTEQGRQGWAFLNDYVIRVYG